MNNFPCNCIHWRFWRDICTFHWGMLRPIIE